MAMTSKQLKDKLENTAGGDQERDWAMMDALVELMKKLEEIESILTSHPRSRKGGKPRRFFVKKKA